MIIEVEFPDKSSWKCFGERVKATVACRVPCFSIASCTPEGIVIEGEKTFAVVLSRQALQTLKENTQSINLDGTPPFVRGELGKCDHLFLFSLLGILQNTWGITTHIEEESSLLLGENLKVTLKRKFFLEGKTLDGEVKIGFPVWESLQGVTGEVLFLPINKKATLNTVCLDKAVVATITAETWKEKIRTNAREVKKLSKTVVFIHPEALPQSL